MKRNRGLQYGYRSGLEHTVSEQLAGVGIEGQYESYRLPYVQPEKKRTYTPDFTMEGNGVKIVIETKGMFTREDRSKHLWLQEQYPDMDLRFVFTNPRSKIYKGAKSTYADWCDKNGFMYAKGVIPNEWIEEVL